MTDQNPTTPQPSVVPQGVRCAADGTYTYTRHVGEGERNDADLWPTLWRRAASDAGWVPVGPPVVALVRLPSGDGEAATLGDAIATVWSVTGEIRRPREPVMLRLALSDAEAAAWRLAWDAHLKREGYSPEGVPVLERDGESWVATGAAAGANWGEVA